MEQDQPHLLLIVGPNGSGKSSIFSELLAQYSEANIEFFNPDIVGETYFADTPDYLNRSKKAILWCGRQQKRCLDEGRSFGLETVGAGCGAINLMDRALSGGYRIELLFVSTEDPSINLRRIEGRVQRGGHWVEPELVVKRYNRVMEKLYQYVDLATTATVVDNSADGKGKAKILLKKNEKGVVVTPDGKASMWLSRYYKQP